MAQLDDYGYVSIVHVTNTSQTNVDGIQVPIILENLPATPSNDGADIRIIGSDGFVLPVGLCAGEFVDKTNRTIWTKINIQASIYKRLELHFGYLGSGSSTTYVNNSTIFELYSEFTSTTELWVGAQHGGPTWVQYPDLEGDPENYRRGSLKIEPGNLTYRAHYSGAEPWAALTDEQRGYAIEARVYPDYTNQTALQCTVGFTNDDAAYIPTKADPKSVLVGLQAAADSAVATICGFRSSTNFAEVPPVDDGWCVLSAGFVRCAASKRVAHFNGYKDVIVGHVGVYGKITTNSYNVYDILGGNEDINSTECVIDKYPEIEALGYAFVGFSVPTNTANPFGYYDWVRVRKLPTRFVGDEAVLATIAGRATTVLPKVLPSYPANGGGMSGGAVFKGRYPTGINLGLCSPYEIYLIIANNPEFITDTSTYKASFILPADTVGGEVVADFTAHAVPGTNYYWKFKVISNVDDYYETAVQTFFYAQTEPQLPAVVITNSGAPEIWSTDNTATTHWGNFEEKWLVPEWTSLVNIADADHNIQLGIENPEPIALSAQHLSLNTADDLVFPANIMIRNEVLAPLPTMKIGDIADLTALQTTLVDEEHLLWWPAREDIASAETEASGGRLYRSSFVDNIGGSVVSYVNKPFSLFKVTLVPNSINKITVMFYNVEPGDYTFDPENNMANFMPQTIYIAYYPAFIGSQGFGALTKSVLPTITNGDQLFFKQVDLKLPIIELPTGTYPNLVYQYLVSDSITNIAIGNVVPATRIFDTTVISLLRLLQPNKPLYIQTSTGYLSFIDGQPNSIKLKSGVQSDISSILYSLAPATGRLYNYDYPIRWISAAEECTLTVYRQPDAIKYRYYVWFLPADYYAYPETYLNYPYIGPFDSAIVYTAEEQQPTTQSGYDTVSHVIPEATLLANIDKLMVWAVKPINAFNADDNIVDSGKDPWSVSLGGLKLGLLWFGEVDAATRPPIIDAPIINETNYSPQLTIRGYASTTYNYKLFMLEDNNWVHYRGIEGSIAIDADGAWQPYTVPLLPDTGILLESNKIYTVVVSEPTATKAPGYSTFNTMPEGATNLTKKYTANPILVDKTESNLVRYAVGISSITAYNDTLATGDVATTRAIALTKPASAIAVEAGKIVPAGAQVDAITCEIQFNDTSDWYAISPLGWDTTGIPQIIFINQALDTATQARLEATYGANAFITLDDVAFSIRLRFTINDTNARLSKFITIRGIA